MAHRLASVPISTRAQLSTESAYTPLARRECHLEFEAVSIREFNRSASMPRNRFGTEITHCPTGTGGTA